MLDDWRMNLELGLGHDSLLRHTKNSIALLRSPRREEEETTTSATTNQQTTPQRIPFYDKSLRVKSLR